MENMTANTPLTLSLNNPHNEHKFTSTTSVINHCCPWFLVVFCWRFFDVFAAAVAAVVAVDHSHIFVLSPKINQFIRYLVKEKTKAMRREQHRHSDISLDLVFELNEWCKRWTLNFDRNSTNSDTLSGCLKRLKILWFVRYDLVKWCKLGNIWLWGV